jgi:hypothetical protein
MRGRRLAWVVAAALLALVWMRWLPRPLNSAAASIPRMFAQRGGSPEGSERPALSWAQLFGAKLQALVTREEPEPATVWGRVVDTEGLPLGLEEQVYVLSPDCLGRTRVRGGLEDDAETGHYELQLRPGPCTVQALIVANGLRLESEPVQLDLGSGELWEEDLVFGWVTEGASAWVHGRVVHEDGGLAEGTLWISSQDCGLWSAVHGGRFSLQVPAGPCTLRALRRDGIYFAQSLPEGIDAHPDEELELELEIDARPTGGIGFQGRVVAEGITIESLYEGSPAFHAGLRPGDLVVEIDGLPTAGQDFATVVDRATGPEGSEVEVLVRTDEDGASVEEFFVLQRGYVE